MWLRGEQVEAEDNVEPAQAATIKLPEGTPVWNDSTVFIQRIHDALVAKGWDSGPT